MKKRLLYKVNKKILYLGFFLIILSLTFFYLAKIELQKTTTKDYSELVMLGKDNKTAYVGLEINYLPYYVVNRTSNNVTLKYYIAVDSNNYMYLVRLTDETYLSMKKIYENDPDNFSYYIEGYIFKTPDELKIATISSYNSLAEQELVNEENFSNYFGKSYLDETNVSYLNSYVFLIVAGILCDIISIFIIVYYFILVINNRKLLKKFDKEKIEQELNSKRTIYFEKLNLYLTSNYIVTKHLYLKIIPYKDIKWIYNEKNNYNGILTNYTLVVYLINNKKKKIVTSTNKEDLISIIKKVSKKNKEVLVGYSKTNKNKYKKYIRYGER